MADFSNDSETDVAAYESEFDLGSDLVENCESDLRTDSARCSAADTVAGSDGGMASRN